MSAPLYAALLLWAAWFASWLAARRWSRATVMRPPRGAETLYTIVVDAGFVLMVAPVFRVLGPRLWALPAPIAWALVAVAGLGFGFCWWARLHLGLNWSWGVTLKRSHEIVETGPYRWVRHPIYTGLIVAGGATTLLEAKALSVAGYGAMAVGLWIKASLEERFLRSELGEVAYAPYAARTGKLLPRL